ncbi:hypothetical protein PsYK624_064330 [Phanerochaete sordida]|uniref:Uncharacterized protein n=1 Tax=Phanerochaete sordida TaxID=48140 RepID=A0A9P3GAF2_9APHY|nr:hypothetical protein PsYK624_064330 [Phanerochaete sordida]
MGQWFKFANIDAQETANGADAKLGEIIWESKQDLVKLLVKYWHVDKTSMNVLTNDAAAAVEAKLASESRLLRLPNELIGAVFDHLEYLKDCICLCAAHRALGMVGKARICALMVPNTRGPWAGQRLICVGDYADEYPASIQDDIFAQLRAYKAQRTPEVPTVDLGPPMSSTGSNADSDVAPDEEAKREERLPGLYECVSYTYCHRNPPSYFCTYIDYYSWRLKKRHGDLHRVSEICRAIEGIRTAINTVSDDLVLCNLTKGEYVRNDAVQQLNAWANEHVQWPVDISLGTVVLTRISWSTDSSCAMHEDVAERLAQGDWAGDRFEIVPIGKLNPDVEWKDATDEAVAWVRKCFEVDMGLA